MNTTTNITAPAASATARVEQLVADHINAVTEHYRRFQLRGRGLAGQEEVNAALKNVEQTLVALCAARADTPADAELKAGYLRDNLAEAACENTDLLNAAIGALIDAGRPAAVGPADDGAERPCRLKALMAEMSVELMRWRGGGHRAIVYPADCRQPSNLQDLLLIPDEPAPPVRVAGCRAVNGESSVAVARLKDAISEAVMASGIAETVLETCFSGAPVATEDGRFYMVEYAAANRLQFAIVQAERLLHVIDDIAEEL
ncbi:hypothetical protein HHL25_02910 [Rhizobium sp. S-51]|uniref:Uncharacterized protein n=1 Tax=Rhizobium terricola TaxID=2728849 RepID=A0A7Y0ATD4_9HYPH|nr:hypothetical protein [Rhizobium terricola]NML73069.1 hypothetical protein [Rhizobium terricola]